MPDRIAIIKPSALGDVVHALPVLSALRARFPDAHITWVVNKAYESLLVGHPHLDATLPFDRGMFKKGPWKAALYSHGFANRLRRQRFDVAVDLQGLLRTGLMCAATGASRKIGFAAAREGATNFYTEPVEVPDADTLHSVDRYLRVASFLGAESRPVRFVVPIRPEEQAAVERELAACPRPWVAVALGVRWETKQWPVASFASLLRRTQAAFGGTVLFVGTSDDTRLTPEAAGRLPGPYRDFTGKTSLPRLAALLDRVDLMVANDTGPLHLAAALGRPCVAPYTCTRTARHGPYGDDRGGVETRVACGGSYLKRCPHNMVCMADLTPEKLWPPVAEGLAAWADRSRSA
ncbi:MAG TPA: glycosyltransferase family 9 protein [Fimbriiglobus sp.]|jgi:lipopolysaccharide heptosyltransferase I